MVVGLLAGCASSGTGAHRGPATSVAPPSSVSETVASSTTSTTSTAPAATGPLRVFVVGDSLAYLLGASLEARAAEKRWIVRDGGVLGCGILPERSVRYGVVTALAAGCTNWAERWAVDLDAFHPDVVVVMNGFWDAYDWYLDGHVVPFRSAQWDAFASARFGAAMDLLSSRGARILWVLGPYYRPTVKDAAVARYYDEVGAYRSALDDDRVRRLNDLYQELAASRRCSVFTPDSRLCLCPGDTYADNVEGVTIRNDGVHFTGAGADRLASFLTPFLTLGFSGFC